MTGLVPMFLLFCPTVCTLWFNDHHIYVLPLAKSLRQSSAFAEWAQRRGLSPWSQPLPPASLIPPFRCPIMPSASPETNSRDNTDLSIQERDSKTCAHGPLSKAKRQPLWMLWRGASGPLLGGQGENEWLLANSENR